MSVKSRLGQAHRFAADRYVYPLVLSSLLACGLYAARVQVYHTLTYFFLVWNLFLAWVPYLWSLWADSIHRRFPQRWWSLLLPGALWLIFFPNALYLITDFLHLHERLPVPLWYDIGLLTMFAWSGCFLAVASLRIMHNIVRDVAGRLVGWLFVIGSAGLTGLGIYLGRFLNWNSWDLVLRPQAVLGDVAHRLIHPLSNLQTYGVTVMFAAFLFACYWMFTSMHRPEQT